MIRILRNAAVAAAAAFALCGFAVAQVQAPAASIQFAVPTDQQGLEATAPELARRVLAAQTQTPPVTKPHASETGMTHQPR